jgi:hypothetical protein
MKVVPLAAGHSVTAVPISGDAVGDAVGDTIEVAADVVVISDDDDRVLLVLYETVSWDA